MLSTGIHKRTRKSVSIHSDKELSQESGKSRGTGVFAAAEAHGCFTAQLVTRHATQHAFYTQEPRLVCYLNT